MINKRNIKQTISGLLLTSLLFASVPTWGTEIDIAGEESCVVTEQEEQTEIPTDEVEEVLSETEDSSSEPLPTEEVDVTEEVVLTDEKDAASKTEEPAVITGFGEFDIRDNYLFIDREDEETEEQVISYMPDTLQVYLDGSQELTTLEVSWYCLENYEETTSYYVQFSPVFDESLYTLDESLNLYRDAPYIGVFFDEYPCGEEVALMAMTFSPNTSANRDKNIYTYLTGTMGYNAASAIGIMANMYAESGWRSNNLQDTYNKSLGLTDDEYTTAVDDETYLIEGYTTTKESFVRDKAGYGLCQWTYWSLKQDLYEYAKDICGTGISDYTMQLQCLGKEISGISALNSSINSSTNTAESAYQVAYDFCVYFERPSNTETQAVSRANFAVNELWPYVESGYFVGGGDLVEGGETVDPSTPDPITPDPVEDDETAKRGIYTIKVTSSLNIRSTPVNGTVVGTLSNGNVVYPTKISDGWGYITYNGVSGWISLASSYSTYNTSLRLAGSTRYETAIATAKEYLALKGKSKLSTIVVASADNFPDALSGSVFAHQKNAPLVFMGSSSTGNSSTLSFIKQYVTSGATVYLLGGTSAISSSCATSIKNAGYSVQRISGSTRYATNLAIVNRMSVSSGTDVFVVSGEVYADALSVSGIAASRGMPIFLTASDAITSDSLTRIKAISPKNIYVVGGTSALSANIVTQLKNACGSASVVRLSGSNRYTTATEVAKYFSMENKGSLIVASGTNFPDGLASGVLAAELDATIVLASNSTYSDASSYRASAYRGTLVIMGGTSALSDTTINQILK